MSKRLWFFTALACLVFVHVFAWYRVPAQVYLRHAADFHTPLTELLGISAKFGLLCLLLSLLLSYLLLLRVRRIAAVAFVALALTFWIIHSLFGQADPVIDAQFQRVDLEQSRAYTELFVFTVLALMLARFRNWLLVPGVAFVTFLAIFYAGNTSRLVAAADVPGPNPDPLLYELSASNHLLVIELGSFESGYFAHWLEREPQLASALDGFHYFPDMLAAASRPGLVVDAALQAGLEYDTWAPLPGLAEDYLEGGSVFSRLAMAGARSVLVQRGPLPCPYRVRCIDSGGLVRDSAQLRLGETAFAVDLALLIMAPEALKNGIYRGGRWLLGTRFTGGGLSGHTRAVFDDHVLLRMFADHAAAGTAGAGVSYLRLESTRTPARLSGDCRVVRASDTQATDAPQQARCALLDVALLVDSLRRKGLYDSTAIVILADTGTPSPAASLLSALDSGTIPGAARPLLLIKPRRSRGPLRTERTALQTADIPKTLCALSGHCSWPRGVAALDPAPVPRSRDFLVYDDDTINTLTGHIDDLQRFRLSGPVDDPGSWNRLIDTSSIEAESRLEFSALDDPGRFGSGWGIVESDPYSGSKRWVVAESATLSLELQTAADYLLEFTLYPPPDLASQRMDFEINGHWLGARELLPGISTVAIRVPAAFIHPGVNELALRFALLADPTGLDERPLAMSFLGLAIGRVVPGQEVEPL